MFDRLQERLLGRLVERLDARRVVGEGDGMDQPVELLAVRRKPITEPGDLVVMLDVAHIDFRIAC